MIQNKSQQICKQTARFILKMAGTRMLQRNRCLWFSSQGGTHEVYQCCNTTGVWLLVSQFRTEYKPTDGTEIRTESNNTCELEYSDVSAWESSFLIGTKGCSWILSTAAIFRRADFQYWCNHYGVLHLILNWLIFNPTLYTFELRGYRLISSKVKVIRVQYLE